MKNGYIKTAAATPYITVADCNANGNEIIRLIHEMEKEHVKVMTFPELCITGMMIIILLANVLLSVGSFPAETSSRQRLGNFAEDHKGNC